MYAVTKKYKIDPETLWIVYDMDDVCWDLIGKLCRMTGIEYWSWRQFYVTQNSNFGIQTQNRVCELLSDKQTWQDIEFYDGIDDIMRPARDFGVNFQLNSNSNNEEICDLKHDQLLSRIPGLQEKNLSLNICIPNQPATKALPQTTVVFVDDNPYHIAGSTAIFDVAPRCP